jgi:hypothetical protein
MHSITFNLYQQLTKTTSIPKMDQAPQRCSKSHAKHQNFENQTWESYK